MAKDWWEETPKEFADGFTEEVVVHHSNPLTGEGLESEQVHTLVPSSNRGRYALDDSDYGHDLTSGDRVAILLAGQWIEGSIEHTGSLYASESTRQAERGYYFIAANGGICGLCSGMKVRRL